MKTILLLFKERPRALGIVVFISAFLPLSVITHRFLMQCFTVAMVLSLPAMLVWRKSATPAVLYNCSIVLGLVSLVSPLDLAIRNSNNWRIGCLPIVRSGQAGIAQKKAAEKGLVENKDYIIYKSASDFLGPYWAIVITVPTEHQIKTPF
jgi:hypothetical protein